MSGLLQQLKLEKGLRNRKTKTAIEDYKGRKSTVDKGKVGKEMKENEEQGNRGKGNEKRVRGNKGRRELGEMDGERKRGKGNVKGKGKIHTV